jgi:hypothetical protein
VVPQETKVALENQEQQEARDKKVMMVPKEMAVLVVEMHHLDPLVTLADLVQLEHKDPKDYPEPVVPQDVKDQVVPVEQLAQQDYLAKQD